MSDNSLKLSRTPVRDANAETITALVKENGETIGYRLSSSRVVSKKEAIQLIREGCIRGVSIAERNGTEYLTPNLGDGAENNFGNLPSIMMDS